MSVNIKVTGGLNIESGQIDPKASGGLSSRRSCLHKLILGERSPFSSLCFCI